jgi:putative ABC transport system permease protein
MSLAVGRRSIERDVDDEMRFHIQMRMEDLMRNGERRDEAERRAAAEYGDVAAARSELAAIDRRRARSQSRTDWFASLRQDIRFGARSLASRPAFTITILLTLALGIGANAAIFGFVDTVLLRPLPFARPDRLVHLWETFESRVDRRSEAAYPDYMDFRSRNRVFTDLGGYQDADFLVGDEHPTPIGGAKVTANFFDVLGVRAVMGRTFVEKEDAPGAPKIALLAHGLWRREFGGDRSIVGRTITISGAAVTVVGVLPEAFRFSVIGNPQVFMPIDRDPATRATRDNHWLNVIGRLRDGVDVRAATANVSAIMRDLAKAYPSTSEGRDAIAVPLHDEIVGSTRPVLLLVYGAVVVVFLIACVNVANLLLIRGADRDRELAVRAALGAGRSRLVRQLITEGLLLAVAGGALALVVAKVGVQALMSVLPRAPLSGFTALTAPAFDIRLIVYTMVVSIIAGLAFGVVPAVRATSPGLSDALRRGGRGTIGGAGRLRDSLVSAEIALTVVLLSGAVLFGKSLVRLLAIDPGFQPNHVVTTTVALPRARYASTATQTDFYRRFEEGIRGLPGVESVGFVSKLPLDFGESLGFDVVGRPATSDVPRASYRFASTEYFRALRIPLMRGRVFATTDDARSSSVGVINRTFAEVYFPSQDPIGQRLHLAGDTVRIVGIVGDVPIGSIGDRIPPTIYLDLGKFSQSSLAVAIRTTASANEMGRMLRDVVSKTDATVALTPTISMEDLVVQSPSVFLRRFPMFVVGAFAVTALVLAIVGIYGVVSYSVAGRTREMGIRMALGAEATSVLGLVMRHGATMAALGILVGLVATRLLGRFAASLLFGVDPGDPLTYAIVAGVLAMAAIVATLMPARRATRVDPALALRSD